MPAGIWELSYPNPLLPIKHTRSQQLRQCHYKQASGEGLYLVVGNKAVGVNDLQSKG